MFEAEVAVVGAGIIGTATAFSLQKLGKKTILIEQVIKSIHHKLVMNYYLYSLSYFKQTCHSNCVSVQVIVVHLGLILHNSCSCISLSSETHTLCFT